jgi:hypothetical protein
MPVSGEPVPSAIDSFWEVIARSCIQSWADELSRDAARARRAIEVAYGSSGDPSDDEIAALEEAFWRTRAASEKADALIAVAYGANALRPYDARAKGLRFRPDYEANSELLKELGTDTALALRAARAAMEGERANLRRNQVVHSVVPIAKLHDLAPMIVVTHHNGSILAYELSRLNPAQWMEGGNSADPASLFALRRTEAERALEKLDALAAALAASLPVDARVEVPQYIWRDEATEIVTLERPESTGPTPSVDIRFVVDGDPAASTHVLSYRRKMRLGEEVEFGDAVWRVIRTEEGAGDSEDQIVHCRVTPRSG